MSCAASADVVLGGGIVGAASLRVGIRMLRTRTSERAPEVVVASAPAGPSSAAPGDDVVG